MIVLVDTLRPDFLGSSGRPNPLTANMDALAAGGVRYANAYSTSSWTVPAVASLLTSRWPTQTGMTGFTSVLPDTERSLPQVLSERGYATAGFLATRVLPAKWGWGRGFLVWDDAWRVAGEGMQKRAGAEVNALAFAWLDARPADERRPVFLYLHYMEPHFPYAPRPALLEAVLAARGLVGEERAAWDERLVEFAFTGQTTPRQMAAVVPLYEAEVASFDLVLGELLDGLRARGMLDRAVVILTADHGEEFLEHGYYGHGENLFQETLRVPLVIQAPGFAPGTVHEVVSLLDVAPTVLDLIGAPPEPSFEGRSLIRAAPAGPVSAYAELPTTFSGNAGVHDRAVVEGTHKLAVTPAGQHEFYDLALDPGEWNPDGLDGAARDRLRAWLDTYQVRARRDAVQPVHRELDPATRERLRALGYGD